jgi:hypothetical protein
MFERALVMSSNVLVFSVALNGYQWLYKRCIASHKRYANKHGYEYQVVSRPYATTIGVECCWLKLTLMLQALENGYDTVLFVDADAYIQTHAPKLEGVFLPNKYLYLAKSYSGRYNSGVILIKNNPDVCLLLSKIIAARYQAISPENDVGWGENGHIIEFTQRCDLVSTLNRSWNNTYDPELNDYVRHFSFGPLRTNLWLNLSHKLLARSTRLITKIIGWLSVKTNIDEGHDELTNLTRSVLKRYGRFTPQ